MKYQTTWGKRQPKTFENVKHDEIVEVFEILHRRYSTSVLKPPLGVDSQAFSIRISEEFENILQEIKDHEGIPWNNG